MDEVYFNDDLMVALLGYDIKNTTCHLFKEDDYFLSLVLSNRSNKSSQASADNTFTSVPAVRAREWYQYVIPGPISFGNPIRRNSHKVIKIRILNHGRNGGWVIAGKSIVEYRIDPIYFSSGSY